MQHLPDEGDSFGAAGREHERSIYNDAAFFLAMAIADDALFGIHVSMIFGSRRFLWARTS
jgi:hypothetical protein